MSLPERPKLRGLLAADSNSHPHQFVLWDRLHLSDAELSVSQVELLCLNHFDGKHTLREVQVEAMRAAGGLLIPVEGIERLARRLAAADFLDMPVRQSVSVRGDPGALRRQLDNLFAGKGGAGRPGEPRPDGTLRAALVPHMDYFRGGSTYTWAFKEIYERTDAALFVIIATSHHSMKPFTLTRKDFATPLGVAPTDQAYIDRLVKQYGPGLFDDEELAHLPEWSVELEVVFLQYLYAGRRPFRIVPLVVGTLQKDVARQQPPAEQSAVGRMVAALRAVEAETDEPICYLISGDLAHIGPYFDDPEPLSDAFLKESRARDQAILNELEKADGAGFFNVIAAEHDERRICGLAPTFVALSALAPGRGKVLNYRQYVQPDRDQSVSFASVTFYR